MFCFFCRVIEYSTGMCHLSRQGLESLPDIAHAPFLTSFVCPAYCQCTIHSAAFGVVFPEMGWSQNPKPPNTFSKESPATSIEFKTGKDYYHHQPSITPTLQALCMQRKSGHDQYCGTNTSWLYVHNPADQAPAALPRSLSVAQTFPGPHQHTATGSL